MASPQGFKDKVAFAWKMADTLRGTFRQHECGQVVLPPLVLHRMDAVLVDAEADALATARTFVTIGALQAMMLETVAGRRHDANEQFVNSYFEKPGIKRALIGHLAGTYDEFRREMVG